MRCPLLLPEKFLDLFHEFLGFGQAPVRLRLVSLRQQHGLRRVKRRIIRSRDHVIPFVPFIQFPRHAEFRVRLCQIPRDKVLLHLIQAAPLQP